jgi:hypothetical protein
MLPFFVVSASSLRKSKKTVDEMPLQGLQISDFRFRFFIEGIDRIEVLSSEI